MDSNEIRALDDAQLVHRELQLERELIEARFRLKTSQLEDSSTLGKLRKDIARLRTDQRRREIATGRPADSLRSAHRASFKAGTRDAAPAPGATKGSAAGFLKGLVDKVKGKE